MRENLRPNETIAALNAQTLRRLARLEDAALLDTLPSDPEATGCAAAYGMTLDDFEAAIAPRGLAAEALLRWYYLIDDAYAGMLGIREILSQTENSEDADARPVNLCLYPQDDRGALADAWYLFGDIVRHWDEADDRGADGLACVRRARKYILYYRQNRALPVEERSYPEFMMRNLVCYLDDEERLNRADAATRARYADAVNRLAAKDDPFALRARCYGAYTGNAVYRQSFFTARDDGERLFELTQDPQYANLLGYIYYYGRCTGGEPEYDKAFRCYAFGAANGLYESIYKLADMYRNGYGVWKSEKTAYRLVSMLYDELLNRFEHGDECCEYADVALRMGSMLLRGIGTAQNVREALTYLLPADYAIRRRIRAMDNYGDNVVAAHIRECVAEARALLPAKKNAGAVAVNAWQPVHALLSRGYRISWQARPYRDDQWQFTFKRLRKPGERHPAKLFLTMPELYYCDFTDQATVFTVPIKGDPPAAGVADWFECDEYGSKPSASFCLDGKPVLTVNADDCVWKIRRPRQAGGRTVRLAGVTFTPGGRQYDYLCESKDVHSGDRVIVEGRDGETEVTVRNVTDVPEEDLALPVEQYKKVLRKA